MSRASLYTNSKGYDVTRHSYSGSESFTFCARKYYLERVQGWSIKTERSSSHFGKALEAAWVFYHRHGLDRDTAVQEFVRLWAEHKEKPYSYNATDKSWDNLNLVGQDLIKLYHVRYPTFPYTVTNPGDSFQVETNFEVFPGTELAGIELTSFIDLVAQLKGSFEPLIVDAKTSGKDVPEFTILDPQLRTYSWVKNWPNVAFLWFRKCGRTIKKGDAVTLLEPYAGLAAGEDVFVLAEDDFGYWVTPNQRVVDEIDAKFVGTKKSVLAEKQAYIEANSGHVTESVVTKQKVQFKHVVISKESSEEIGRSIKRDIVNIYNATKNDFFPMQSGVRFPNEKCPNCDMRGICSNRPALRDELLIRKQIDEFDFGKESE